jgi:hypothetical protein
MELVHWGGLFLCVIGMAFSGSAVLARSTETAGAEATSEIFPAMLLAILSHALQAFQTIMEERFLGDDAVNAATLTVFEGVWGSFICIFVFLPACAILNPSESMGLYENSIESFQLLGKSVKLTVLVVGVFVCVAAYSFFGILVTQCTSAVQRNLLEMLKPLAVWGLCAIMHWQSTDERIGEPIDKFTIFELLGFLLTIGGIVVLEKIWICAQPRPEHRRMSTLSLLRDSPSPLGTVGNSSSI